MLIWLCGQHGGTAAWIHHLLKVSLWQKQKMTKMDGDLLTSSLALEEILVRPFPLASGAHMYHSIPQNFYGASATTINLSYSLLFKISAPVNASSILWYKKEKKSVMICLMITSHEKFYITTIKRLFVLIFYYSLRPHWHCIAQNSHIAYEGFVSIGSILLFNRFFF